jgi:glyoxylase-like metal-dependent hydrolase (beta-lactamase superfamily II)
MRPTKNLERVSDSEGTEIALITLRACNLQSHGASTRRMDIAAAEPAMSAPEQSNDAKPSAPELQLRTDMDFAYGVPKSMAPGVVRIVANNPSPYTFKGTNTYLIGERELMLLDPGPDDPAHLDAILKTAAGRPIRWIVLTHRHSDHVAGLPAAKAAIKAPVTAYPLTAIQTDNASPSSSERMLALTPDRPLAHGDKISVDGFTLEAIFTPGHAPDHLCFALESTHVQKGILFSGDHVMGWNTSVVAPPEGNMGDYLASLERLIARTTDTVYFPGHGGRIENPLRMTRAYLVHRHMREEAIREAIAKGARTISSVVAVVYKGLDPRLTRAAALSVEAHVVHLAQRGKVRFSSPLGAGPSQSSDLAAV